jgi:hypothetical protein
MTGEECPRPTLALSGSEQRYAEWLRELDAWTEYWDIYHPETRGRFYFGDGNAEPGLLTSFLPRERKPPVFLAWRQAALRLGSVAAFLPHVLEPDVASAIMEVDALVERLFRKYFGDPTLPGILDDYLEAMFRCGTDSLPPDNERYTRIPESDWRKPTSGRNTIDSDIMWFCWAMHTEGAQAISGNEGMARRALQIAGVAVGCSANFAWRRHRRTRPEYKPDAATAALLRDRGRRWATDFSAATNEVHALFRIREWGHE